MPPETKATRARKLPEIEKRGPKKRSHAAIAEQFERTTGKPAEGKEFQAFAAQQRGEEPDDAPESSGGRGSPRVAVGRKGAAKGSKAVRSFERRVQGFLRVGTANPRKVLMLELLAVLTIVTVDQFAHGEVPSPRAYAAPFIVYLVLTFMAELGGDGGARVATGLGALVLVALVVANAPGIVRALQVVSGQRAITPEGVG